VRRASPFIISFFWGALLSLLSIKQTEEAEQVAVQTGQENTTTMGAALKIDNELGITIPHERAHKRRSSRADAFLCIDLCSEHNFWTGLTMNLSEGGVFVATHHILPTGSLVALHLELPREKRIMVLGEVKWSRDYTGNDDVPPGLGIQFVGLDAPAQAAIRRFIKTIREPHLFEH
jgi:uncharacterized protein (TIGR02266 family)